MMISWDKDDNAKVACVWCGEEVCEKPECLAQYDRMKEAAGQMTLSFLANPPGPQQARAHPESETDRRTIAQCLDDAEAMYQGHS